MAQSMKRILGKGKLQESVVQTKVLLENCFRNRLRTISTLNVKTQRVNLSEKKINDDSRLLRRKRLVHNADQRRFNLTSAATATADDTRISASENSVKTFEEIPGPRSYPLIGGLIHILPGGQFHGMHPDDKQIVCQKRYGNIYKETLIPGLQFVHLFDPVDIETVYRSDTEFPVRKAFFTLDYYNRKYNKQQGLLTSQGENWQRIRKNVQQKMLRPKAVAAYLPEQTIVADELLHQIESLMDSNGEVEDLRPEFDKYAAECVGVVCFNRRLQAFDDKDDSEAANFIKAVATIMHMSYLEFKQLPWFRLFNTSTFNKFVEAQSFIRSLSTKYTAIHLEEMAAREERADGEHGDLIPYLLSHTELSQDDVLTVISEFIFAGVDTTSHHLSFIMYLLGTNPEVQETLAAEVQSVLHGNQDITEQTLGRMSYLKAVTKETHRLLPVAPGNIRTSTKDLVLAGYHVPAGCNIALHHVWTSRSEIYYRDAPTFKPERWIRGSETQHGAHPFATLPFGHGVRSCIGRRLAEQESQIAVIKILQKYRVEYTGEPLQTEQSTTVTPVNKMRFKLTNR